MKKYLHLHLDVLNVEEQRLPIQRYVSLAIKK